MQAVQPHSSGCKSSFSSCDDRLVASLARRLNGGDLALLSSVGGALEAVEAMREEGSGAVEGADGAPS